MPSILASILKLRLGPDDLIDQLPRSPALPNVFVAAHYEYLSNALSRHFASVPDIDIDSSKGTKRQREEEGDVELDCELVHSRVDGEQVLGLLQMGSEPVFFDTLAVVAIISNHLQKNVTSTQQADSYECKITKKAIGERDAEAVLIGHIVLNRMQQDHPINYIDQSLLKSGWIKFSKATITLQRPFLPPREDVYGPSSSHHIGRAARSLTVELGGSRVWRDSVTKQVWTQCPFALMPAPEISGMVQFEMEITDHALTYGTSKDHDGFVDALTVSRRDLNLATKLKAFIWACIDSKEGLLSVVPNEEYWQRTPGRYHDEGSVSLPLDNRIETALEATRPSLTATMQEPCALIKSELLPFQKRALSWMLYKELNVEDDEGALLPHWIILEITKSSSDNMNAIDREIKRQRCEIEGEPVSVDDDLLYMDSFTGTLSRQRMVCRQSEPGGCLCDDMGLGKSLTTLSLIETHQRSSNYVDNSRTAHMTAELSSDIRPFISQSTLLIVPSSLIHQWYGEINKHFQLNEDEDREGHVLRYKYTMTIPWTAELDRQTVRSQAKAKFTGQKQARIVLATIEELAKEMQISKRSKKAISPLLEIHWWRVILDEAQLVTMSNGSAATMINCLWRTNGWIISSTPFNSSIRDMQGILSFLDSDFASKKLFEEMIALPFLAGDTIGIQRTHSLLKRFIWRHKKVHVESELGLPPSTSQTLLLEKKGLEKTLYEREYKAMRALVQSNIGLGRSLTKKQNDRLLGLRKLISHPQLASNLGYGGSQRSTFANLFADLIFRNQGELYNVQMEYITLILKIAAGNNFRKEEKDVDLWKGGVPKLPKFKEKLLKAREYARQAETRDIVSKKIAVISSSTLESKENTEKAVQQSTSEVKMETQEHIESEGVKEDTQIEETATKEAEKIAAPITMRYDEALYWIESLLSPKATIESSDVLIDPERLYNLFFEKRIVEAQSVDLEDPRYHPILLDAGDDEEEGQEAEASSTIITSEALLLKNRFRGTTNRRIEKVWFYYPRRKLQALCRDVPAVEERLARLEGEGSYLENRIREELGEDKARIVLKEGFDALQTSQNDKIDDKKNACPLCYEVVEVPGCLPCLHTACFACLLDCINKIGLGGSTPCPLCRKPFEKKDIVEVLPSLDESDHLNEYGVKIAGLISHIRNQIRLNPIVKIVVFSQWSIHLKYLTEALNNMSEAIKSVAFSGKNSKALKHFQDDDDIRIILVPMKQSEGAAGLTLNVASIAYLLEPSLDSALESQALGRLSRIGQKADKTIYFRMLAENTIEPAMVQVAERRLAELKDKDADARHHDTLNIDELAFVFDLNLQEEKAKRKSEQQSRAARAAAQIGDGEEFVDQEQDVGEEAEG